MALIKPEQIPDEVVEAARYAFHNATGPTAADDWHVAIAYALNAWPGSYSLAENDSAEIRGVAAIILPLPQKEGDA